MKNAMKFTQSECNSSVCINDVIPCITWRPQTLIMTRQKAQPCDKTGPGDCAGGSQVVTALLPACLPTALQLLVKLDAGQIL